MRNIYTIKEDNTIDWNLFKLEDDNYTLKNNEKDIDPPSYILAKWDGANNCWIEGYTVTDNDIKSAKESKLIELDASCKDYIINNFKSSAFNNILKNYDCTVEDQANMTGNASAAMSKLLNVPGCESDTFIYKASNEAEYYEWTAQQCLHLARDMKKHKEEALGRLKWLESILESLTTIEDINKLNWESELIG